MMLELAQSLLFSVDTSYFAPSALQKLIECHWLVVIINAESGGGATTRDAWPKIASDLSTHFGAFTPLFTSDAGQGIELAAKAARKGATLIIACGGDGTISEVANGIIATGNSLECGDLSPLLACGGLVRR